MASTDSTGLILNGWSFDQYSSSGGVMRGSSEAVLQLNEGLVVEGVVTAGSSTVVRELQMNTITTTGATLVEGKNTILVDLKDDIKTSLPTAAKGLKVSATIFGGSSQTHVIQTISSADSLNKNLQAADTSYYGIIMDNDTMIASLGFGMGFVFESSGPNSWVITQCSPSSECTMSTAVPA